MRKDKKFYYILGWTILIELIILCKYAFWMPHTLIAGSVCTIILIGILIFNDSRLGFKKYCLDKIRFCKYNISAQFITILIIGILIVIAGGLLRDLSFVALGLVVSIIMPLFFIVTNNDGFSSKRIVVDAITFGTTIIFVAFVIMSIILVPLSYTQYSSVIGNPNEMGNLLIFVTACLIYRLVCTKKIIYLFYLAVSTAFVVFSISRTTYLCICVMFIISMIYYGVVYGHKNLLINICKSILVFTLVFFITFAMLTSGNKCIRNIEKTITGHEYIYYAKLYKYDGSELTLSKLKDYIELRLGKGISENDTSNQHIVDKNINVNEVSSGRISIWKEFIDEINWKGHKTGDTVYVEAVNQNGSDAHNTYINNGYYYGILSFISIAFYMVLLAYYYIRQLFYFVKSREEDVFFLFSALIYISFFILSMLSSVFSPFHSIIGFGFWTICLYRKKDWKYKLYE